MIIKQISINYLHQGSLLILITSFSPSLIGAVRIKIIPTKSKRVCYVFVKTLFQVGMGLKNYRNNADMKNLKNPTQSQTYARLLSGH